MLYKKAGVPNIQNVYRRLEVTSIAYTSMIKDLMNPVLFQRSWAPPTMILAQFEGLLALLEHVYSLNFNMDDMGINVDMGEYRDAPKVAIDVEGDPTTSTSS